MYFFNRWDKVIAAVILICFVPFCGGILLNESEVVTPSKISAPNESKFTPNKLDKLKSSLYLSNQQFVEAELPNRPLLEFSNKIKPYLSLTWIRNFRYPSYSGELRIFFPCWQNAKRLIFTDLRLYETQGVEINVHLGYRQGENLGNLWGIYFGFDQRQGKLANFQQLIFGAEIWRNSWFIGANIYQPIFKTVKFIEKSRVRQEIILPGYDFTVGKEFYRNWFWKLTGYYFHRELTYTGLRGRLEYSIDPLTIFSELQCNYKGDWQAALGIKVKLGSSKGHASALVYRDPNIILLTPKEVILPNFFEEDVNWAYWEGNLDELSYEQLNQYKTYLEKQLKIESPVNLTSLKEQKRRIALNNHPDRTQSSEEVAIFIQFMREYQRYLNLHRFLNNSKKGSEDKNGFRKKSTVRDAKLLIKPSEEVTPSLADFNKQLVLHPDAFSGLNKLDPKGEDSASYWLMRHLAQHRILSDFSFIKAEQEFSDYLPIIEKLPNLTRNSLIPFLLENFLTASSCQRSLIVKILTEEGKELLLKPLQEWEEWWEFDSKENSFSLQNEDLKFYRKFYQAVVNNRNIKNHQKLIERVIYPEEKPMWLKIILATKWSSEFCFANGVLIGVTEEERKQWLEKLRVGNLLWINNYLPNLPVQNYSSWILLIDFLGVFEIPPAIFEISLRKDFSSISQLQGYLLFYHTQKIALPFSQEELIRSFLDSSLSWEIKLRFIMGHLPLLSEEEEILSYLNLYKDYLAEGVQIDAAGRSLVSMLQNPPALTLKNVQFWLSSVTQGSFLEPEQFWEQFVKLNGGSNLVVSKGRELFDLILQVWNLYPQTSYKSFGNLLAQKGASYYDKLLTNWGIPKSIRPCLPGKLKALDLKCCLKELERDNDFLLWFRAVQGKSLLKERLLVIMEASRRIFGFIPHFNQLFAATLPFFFEKGLLSQVGTGEGKSLIIAIHAFLGVGQGIPVDISTSSLALSIRDVKVFDKLYALFGIESGDLSWRINQDPISPKKGSSTSLENSQENRELYHYPILYGSIEQYIGDDLQDTHYYDLRISRNFNGIQVADEVDYLFLDRNDYAVMIGTTFPGHDNFRLLLTDLWSFAIQWLALLEIKGENCFLKQEELPSSIFKLGWSLSGVFDQQLQAPKAKCENWLRGILIDRLDTQSSILLPDHLQQFLRSQSSVILDNLAVSFSLLPRENFLLESQTGYTTLEPLELTTGIEMKNMQLTGGLHIFLALNQNILLPEEDLVSLEETYPFFYRKYRYLNGFSGTLGTNNDLALLEKVYGVNTALIPNYVEKNIKKLPIIWTRNEEEWFQKIAEECVFLSKVGRVVIVIFETIAEAEHLEEKLYLDFMLHSNVVMYVKYQSEQAKLIQQQIEPGVIVITTNLGGRGTDFKLSDQVILCGGCHLIKTHLSDKKRVDDQAIGRVGRQGQPGSYQFILNFAGESCGACQADDRIYYEASAAEALYQCMCKERDAQDFQIRETILNKFDFLDRKQQLREQKTAEERDWLTPFLPRIVFGETEANLGEISIILYQEDVYAVKGQIKKNLTEDILRLRNETFNNLRQKLENKLFLLNFHDDQVLRFLLIVHGFGGGETSHFYPQLMHEVETKLFENSEDFSKLPPTKQQLLRFAIWSREARKIMPVSFREKLEKTTNFEQREFLYQDFLFRMSFELWQQKNHQSIREILVTQLNEDWSIFNTGLEEQFIPKVALQKWLKKRREKVALNCFLDNAVYYIRLGLYLKNQDNVVQNLNQGYWSLISSVPYQQAIEWIEEQSLRLEANHHAMWIRRLFVAENRLVSNQRGADIATKNVKTQVQRAKEIFLRELELIMEGINRHSEAHQLVLLEIPASNREEVTFQLSAIARLEQIFQSCQRDKEMIITSRSTEKILPENIENWDNSLNLTMTAKRLGVGEKGEGLTEVTAITERYDVQLRENGFQKHILKKVKLKANRQWLERLKILGLGILEVITGSLTTPFLGNLALLTIKSGVNLILEAFSATINQNELQFGKIALTSILRVASNYVKSLFMNMVRKIPGIGDLIGEHRQEESVQQAIVSDTLIGVQNLLTYQILNQINNKLFFKQEEMVGKIRIVIEKVFDSHRDILERLLMLDYLEGNHWQQQSFESEYLSVIQTLISQHFKPDYFIHVDRRNAKEHFEEMFKQIEEGFKGEALVQEGLNNLFNRYQHKIPSHQFLLNQFLKLENRSIITSKLDVSIKNSGDCEKLVDNTQACLDYFTLLKKNSWQEKILSAWVESLGYQFSSSLKEVTLAVFHGLERALLSTFADYLQVKASEFSFSVERLPFEEPTEMEKTRQVKIIGGKSLKKAQQTQKKLLSQEKKRRTEKKDKLSTHEGILPKKVAPLLGNNFDAYIEFNSASCEKEFFTDQNSLLKSLGEFRGKKNLALNGFFNYSSMLQQFNSEDTSLHNSRKLDLGSFWAEKNIREKLMDRITLPQRKMDEKFLAKIGKFPHLVGNIRTPAEINNFLEMDKNQQFKVNSLEELAAKIPPNSLIIGERPLIFPDKITLSSDEISKVTTLMNKNWRVLHRHIFYTDEHGELHNIGVTRKGDGFFYEDPKIINKYRFSSVATNIRDLPLIIENSVNFLKENGSYPYNFWRSNCQHFSEKIAVLAFLVNSTSNPVVLNKAIIHR